MITFFIMLYLAFTLVFTILFIIGIICAFKSETNPFRDWDKPSKIMLFILIIICLLWSIWYMYLIN